MSEMKRVVRKAGKIVGVEPGDPHAPSADDFRSATKDLAEAQAALQKVVADSGMTLPQAGATDGMNAAMETLAESWHAVPDQARYELADTFKRSPRARSVRQKIWRL
jgi:hypothetical protein